MQNAKLDESQDGIKMTRRNINNLRYADGTTLMAESEEKLKSFLMKVKEDIEKAGLKLNIIKTKITVSGLITSWQIEGGKVEAMTNIIFLGSKITANGEKIERVTGFVFLHSKITVDGDCSHEIKRCLLLGKKSFD